MAFDNNELRILTDEELNQRINANTSRVANRGKRYKGPERRICSERRWGPNDRRSMIRFEAGKPADRRSGRDPRKGRLTRDDIWDRY